MLKRLEAIERRFSELEGFLADPKILSDRKLYQQYAKERSSLLPAISVYREYGRVVSQIKQTEEMLSREGQEKEILELAQEELSSLHAKKTALEEKLREFLIEEDPEAERDVIMEIRAGTGGLEASLFVADLYRMYTKYAAGHGFKIDIMNTSPTEAGGFKEIIFALQGKGAYKRFKFERGVHRVQRVPETEASGRIHTSAVTVAVLPEAEEVDLEVNPKDLKIDVFRSSGPGGQGVNTTDSAVRITHIPTNTIVTCQDERSQLKNKNKALRVLRARLLDKMKQEQRQKIAKDRKGQVGTGDRSEKIRTYNFPDRRVTDHRIGLTLYKLDRVMEGELDEIINALIEADRKGALGARNVDSDKDE